MTTQRLTLAIVPVAIVAGLTPALAFPVLGRISSQLHVSTAAVSWVLTSSFIASAVLTPIVGRLGDIFGRRSVLLATLGLVLVGSVVAATTTNFSVLIGARVLQGLASTLYPLATSTLQHHLRGRQMTRSIATISSLMGIGGSGGFVVAGLVGSGSDYRTIFWFPVAACVTAVLAVLIGVPTDKPGNSGTIDATGCAVLCAGLVLVLLPLSQAAKWGFASPRVLGCLAVGIAILVAFDLIEKRAVSPITPPRLLYHRPILTANVLSVLMGASTFLPLVAIPILLQSTPSIVGGGSPVSPLATALIYLLPGNALGIVGAPIGNRVARHHGARAAAVLVGIVALVGSVGPVLAPGTSATLVVGMFLTCTALYMFYGALPYLLVPYVDTADLGAANGMNSLGRWIGSALVTALVSLVLTSGTTHKFGGETTFRLAFAIGVAVSAGVILAALFGLPSARRSSATRVGERPAAETATASN